MTVYKIKTGSMARKAVLAYLWSIQDEGTAHAGMAEIGEAIEASHVTVTAAVGDLIKAGHISVAGSKLKGESRARIFDLLTKSPEGD